MPGEIKIIIRGDPTKFEQELEEVDKKRIETEQKVDLTISNTLIALRAITDIVALVSVVTGEEIDIHYLTMISTGLSAALQMKVMAAAYAVTPGGAPLAMMMLAMIPILTGMVVFIQGEQRRVQAMVDKSHADQLDNMLDSVNL